MLTLKKRNGIAHTKEFFALSRLDNIPVKKKHTQENKSEMKMSQKKREEKKNCLTFAALPVYCGLTLWTEWECEREREKERERETTSSKQKSIYIICRYDPYHSFTFHFNIFHVKIILLQTFFSLCCICMCTVWGRVREREN